MKVLHVAKTIDPENGGVARHIEGLVAACRPYAVEARIIGAGMPGLGAAIRAVDVVHLHGARTPIVLKAALLATLYRRPMVYTPHCYYDSGALLKRLVKRLWDRLAEALLVRRAGATILLDRFWQADLAARNLRPRQVAIIPNCIVTPPAAECCRPDGRPSPPIATAGDPGPVLLSVGRLDPVKRLDDVIATLADPALGRAVFHIVGSGEDRSRLERLAQAVGVDRRVIFHGRLDDQAVGHLRALADLFLLPSEREGLPTVMLENLARGLPVLASDIAANRAIAEAIGWPALFPLGDRAALAAAIGRWAGAKVPPVVTEALMARFTWEARAPEVIALYRDAMA